jgi:hypothetical protein
LTREPNAAMGSEAQRTEPLGDAGPVTWADLNSLADKVRARGKDENDGIKAVLGRRLRVRVVLLALFVIGLGSILGMNGYYFVRLARLAEPSDTPSTPVAPKAADSAGPRSGDH